MRLHDAWVMLGLLWTTGAGATDVQTVVTLDNGEFNAPLYTPRWNGQYAQPSAAQEIVIGIARVSGENPTVFTYLPAGAAAGRSGEPVRVHPRLSRCVGPATAPSDPCTCGPADRCWDGLGGNYHPDASTSLYLAAAGARKTLSGPRIEVHFSDLFEEDPAAADNPRDLDRCVTADGARKAVAGLFKLGNDEDLDHAAVGVLRVQIDPPPPGPHRGFTYRFARKGEGPCWSGTKGTAWGWPRSPLDVSMAVLVLGVNTGEHSGLVDEFVEGLKAQLSSETLELELVTLRQPSLIREVTGQVTAGEEPAWRIPPPEQPVRVPCERASVSGRVMSGEAEVALGGLTADCSGGVFLQFAPGALEGAHLEQAGLDPRVDGLHLTGALEVQADRDALQPALERLGDFNLASSDRPLPLWTAAEPAMVQVARPFAAEIGIASLQISDADARPWLLMIAVSLAVGIVFGGGIFWLLQRIQAERALRSRWSGAVGLGDDPLRQIPLATILAEARQDVHRTRLLRVGLGLLAAAVGAAVGAHVILQLVLVSL